MLVELSVMEQRYHAVLAVVLAKQRQRVSLGVNHERTLDPDLVTLIPCAPCFLGPLLGSGAMST